MVYALFTLMLVMWVALVEFEDEALPVLIASLWIVPFLSIFWLMWAVVYVITGKSVSLFNE